MKYDSQAASLGQKMVQYRYYEQRQMQKKHILCPNSSLVIVLNGFSLGTVL